MEYRKEKSGAPPAEPAADASDGGMARVSSGILSGEDAAADAADGAAMPQNAFRVTVDGVADHDFRGHIWYPRQDIVVPFHDTTQFLIRTEELLNRWTAPRLTGPLQVFKKRKGRRKMDTTIQQVPPAKGQHPRKPMGERGTFLVKVLFRQNNSWQGEVIWAEANERRNFRSALELIKLIDSAIDSSAENTEE